MVDLTYPSDTSLLYDQVSLVHPDSLRREKCEDMVEKVAETTPFSEPKMNDQNS